MLNQTFTHYQECQISAHVSNKSKTRLIHLIATMSIHGILIRNHQNVLEKGPSRLTHQKSCHISQI